MNEAAEHGAMAARSGGPYSTTPYQWNQPYSGHGWYPWYLYWDPSVDHGRFALVLSGRQAIRLVRRARRGYPEA